MADDAAAIRRRWTENPFYVLGVPTDAPRVDVERAAQRLLAELAAGRASVATYATPFGIRPRTEDAVRAAIVELRDPKRRLLHELWAALPVGDPNDTESAPWPDAFAAVGWKAL